MVAKSTVQQVAQPEEPELAAQQKTEDVETAKPETAQVAVPEESVRVVEEAKAAEIDKVDAPIRGTRDKVESLDKEDLISIEQDVKPKPLVEEG